ncbi:hypothetical protein RB653_003610 [Dictyostelium firmibasis]|uniref:FNIP repeat-containing protein n=1 Tax=Dictyostelium firmibasis TaxID=79012 RepID=A0AAN7U8B9_9MYCE
MLYQENINNNSNKNSYDYFDNYEGQELFFKVFRNVYLKYLIFSYLYRSELLIDNKEIRGMPPFPRLLNNVTISKGTGFCNFFCKNLFLDGKSQDNNKIKELIKKEGLNQFSFLSKFYINSFVVDNLSLSVFQDYGFDFNNNNNSYTKTPLPILKDLNIIWKKEYEVSTKEIEFLKDYINVKSDYLQVQSISMLKTVSDCTIKHLEIRIQKERLSTIETPLPRSLKKLSLGECYDHPLTLDMIHDGIKCLNVGYKWNQILFKDSTPTSITQLTLGDCFNKPFTNKSLPDNIRILKLGRDFKEFSSLENLNSNIHTLKFNNNFNSTLTSSDNSLKLPNSITTLEFGEKFNQEINDSTFLDCKGLKILKFGKSFSKVLSSNNIPDCVEKLIIPFKTKLLITDDQFFNRFYSIDNQLKLNNNYHLRINCKHILNNSNINNNRIGFNFPLNCNSVTFEDNSYIEFVNKQLPSSIKYLEFGEDFRNETSKDQFNKRITIRASDIPKGTTHLSIQSNNVILDHIPSNITHLKTCSNYSHPINILHSNNLVSLKTSLSNINYLKMNF